jgi:CelD/BcsL family acetyltransferase involved in cellulose biosynthesis
MSIASLPRTRPLSVEAVTAADALEALRPEWEQLWSRARASPFLSPAWLLPWWKHVGRGELASAAIRDEDSGELVGLAALYVLRDDHRARRLFPLGIATTDHLDALALPGREDDVAEAIVQHLIATASGWDVFEAPQLRPHALLLRCRWPASWRRELRDCEPHPALALPARVPLSLARTIAYSYNRAEREAELTIETAGPTNIAPLLEALAELHTRRWARRGMPGVLGEPGVLAWHREAAPQLWAEGLLRLCALCFAERVIGVFYGLADAAPLPRRRWYFYIGGFDPQFGFLSPGTLLIDHAIRAATSEGASCLDFLRGAEDYKYRWGAVDEPMFALLVSR